MSDVEALIRKLCDGGTFSHLSIVSRQPVDNRSPTMYGATFAHAGKWGYSFAESTDPIEAIVQALTTAPKVRPTVTNPVTGAVTDKHAPSGRDNSRPPHKGAQQEAPRVPRASVSIDNFFGGNE